MKNGKLGGRVHFWVCARESVCVCKRDVWVFYTCTRSGYCVRLQTVGGATEGEGEGAEESG